MQRTRRATIMTAAGATVAALAMIGGSLADGLDPEDVRACGMLVLIVFALRWVTRRARLDAAYELGYREGHTDGKLAGYSEGRRARLTLIRPTGAGLGDHPGPDSGAGASSR